jgi:S-formylglutathione hydrolase FrmB
MFEFLTAGSGDGFLEVQLKPEAFQAAADAAGYPVTMRMQEGYDHRWADGRVHCASAFVSLVGIRNRT